MRSGTAQLAVASGYESGGNITMNIWSPPCYYQKVLFPRVKAIFHMIRRTETDAYLFRRENIILYRAHWIEDQGQIAMTRAYVRTARSE